MSKCSGTSVQLAHSRTAFWSGDLPQQILGRTLTHLVDYKCACRQRHTSHALGNCEIAAKAL